MRPAAPAGRMRLPRAPAPCGGAPGMSVAGAPAQQPGAMYVHVGLGDDWLLYAAAPGTFPLTEMLAPGLVLGPSDGGIRLRMVSGQHIHGQALLHAAGAHSAGDADAIVVLYLDPLTDEGAMLQAEALAHAGAVRWDGDEGTGSALLDMCRHDGLTAPALAQWVCSLRKRLRNGLPALRGADPRMHAIARALARHPEGRPGIPALAHMHSLSADHLRQTFRRMAGMTISRYQMWRRICAMVDHACLTGHRPQRSGAHDAIHAAGFYDMPHGTKALRRYFGLTPLNAVSSGIRFLDCRAPTGQRSE